MTERTEIFEVHPMKGHSRGEWYGTERDIVKDADLAEYWAVFGTTHRGNKHCLGEFSSEAAAWTAVRGLKFFPTRGFHSSRPAPAPDFGAEMTRASPVGEAVHIRERRMATHREIVQIEVSNHGDDDSMLELFALCSDGTVWNRGIGIGKNRGLSDASWTEISLRGMQGTGR